MSRSAASAPFANSSVAHNPQSAPYVQWGIYAAMVAALAYGLYRAIAGWWVCDDAFITFRYAKNLVSGHGLVYNIGERVEGYSNFLWTVITAGGMKLGLDPVPFSVALGLISYVAVVATCTLLSRRLFDEREQSPGVWIPVAAILLLLHREMQVFATSGLETMWTTALVMLGFVLVLLTRSARGYLAAGFVLIGAALSRPDGLLFYVMVAPFILVVARDRWRMLGMFLAPLVIVYVPYWIIRYSYYGYPLPNTYYAKSAGLSYYSQGWIYLWLYVKAYYVLFLSPLAAGLLLWCNRKQMARLSDGTLAARATVLALLFIVPYMWYVVRVGGDFMFGRFWIVVTPLLLLLMELGLSEVVKRRDVYIGAVAVLGLLVFFRIDLFAASPRTQISGIAYEPAFYPRSWYDQAKADGDKLKRYLAGQDVSVAFAGTHAIEVYYSEVPVAIESATGLTDAYIAHLPLYERGRPGHEKKAPIEYLRARKVNFFLIKLPPASTIQAQLTRVSLEGYEVRIVCYDSKVMDVLATKPGVKMIRVPEFLDQFLVAAASMPRDEILESYDFFRTFYFDYNQDPVHQQAFERLLGK